MSAPTVPVSSARRNRRTVLALALLTAVVVAVVSVAIVSHAPATAPSSSDQVQPGPISQGPRLPQLLHLDGVLGVPDRRLQIRFRVTPDAYAGAGLGFGSGPVFTWTVDAPSGADEPTPTKAGDWASPPLAQGKLSDPDASYTVTVPCGPFTAFPTIGLSVWAADGTYFTLNVAEFTLPSGCPRLTAYASSKDGLDATHRWSIVYRVAITGVSGPVRWTQTAYRRGVPGDQGTLLSSKTMATGAATNLGHHFTCGELLRYSYVRLLATDRLGLAGWFDVELPYGYDLVAPWLAEACPSSSNSPG